jgi:nuclear RNA export factor
MPNQRKLEWSTWLEVGSRNLNRIASDPQKTLANFHVGGEQIVKALLGFRRRNMISMVHQKNSV